MNPPLAVYCVAHDKWLVLACTCAAYCGHLHYHCPWGLHVVMAAATTADA